MIEDAKAIIEAWRRDYKENRPHMALKDYPPKGVHASIRRLDRRKLIVKTVREIQAAQTTGSPRPPWSGPAGSRPPRPPSSLDVLFHYRAHVAVLEYALRISLGHYTSTLAIQESTLDRSGKDA
jgi:hypothetical protein